MAEIKEEELIRQEVLKFRKSGISCRDIYRGKNNVPWCLSKIEKEVEKALAEGEITQEEIKKGEEKRECEKLEKMQKSIEEAKDRKRRRELDRVKTKKVKKLKKVNKASEKEEIMQRILAYKRQGMSDREIYKSTDIQIVETTIRAYVKEAIEAGLITTDEIEQAREERKYYESLNQSRKIIDEETKLSYEQMRKIRKCINLIYEREKISKEELIFLKQAIQKVPIDDKDIVKFVKLCVSIDEYGEALDVIKSRHTIQKLIISEDREEALKGLENELKKLCKVQDAMRLLKRENANIGMICKVTGLSENEVSHLKTKLEEEEGYQIPKPNGDSWEL